MPDNKMKNELHVLISNVRSEATFLEFLEALMSDWEDEQKKERINPSSPYAPGANGWENGTIGAFLESATAWARDTPRDTPGPQDSADTVWNRAASILYAGKFYE